MCEVGIEKEGSYYSGICMITFGLQHAANRISFWPWFKFRLLADQISPPFGQICRRSHEI